MHTKVSIVHYTSTAIETLIILYQVLFCVCFVLLLLLLFLFLYFRFILFACFFVWYILSVGQSALLTLNSEPCYLKNLKLFSVRVNKLFLVYSVRKKRRRFLFLFFSFSSLKTIINSKLIRYKLNFLCVR